MFICNYLVSCSEVFPLPLGAWDRLRCFIVTLPRPSILFLTSDLEFGICLVYSSISANKKRADSFGWLRSYSVHLFIYCFVCLFDLVFDDYDQQLRLLTVS